MSESAPGSRRRADPVGTPERSPDRTARWGLELGGRGVDGLLARATRKLIFADEPSEGSAETKRSRYRRMWQNTVATVAAVSIIPLVAVSLVNYFLYRRSFMQEITQPLGHTAAMTKRSLESFLSERIAAERYILYREEIHDLYEPSKLGSIFARMRDSYGGIVDVGVIDDRGVMRAYAGPYDLQGRSYDGQDWFHKVLVREVYVSDVFLGHRQIPHFVIAVRRADEEGRACIFRATIDTDVLNKQIPRSGLRSGADSFVINTEGVLQTPSRLFGATLGQFPGEIPPPSESSEVAEVEIEGTRYFMGYAYVDRSPFVFVILSRASDLTGGWLAYQSEILILLTVSSLAIILIIMGITSNWVGRIRLADLRREATLHQAEHANKMASIGRLAAGVAHEINNPLAIINEKAGLMRDIIGLTEGMPRKDKLLTQVDSILGSVKRCSDITHRLLGFARHMDVKNEPVAVDALVRDVLRFLEKEATYRNVQIQMCVADALPTVHSDKGQLQQLFLNIINNAFDAVGKDGHVAIDVSEPEPGTVEVCVIDDGCGIPKENLERIFEPFFTTKQAKGTGLGLSICYGIVQKLRGTMTVTSEVGVGTTFVIALPVERPEG